MKIYLIYFLSIYGIPPSVMTEYEGTEKQNYVYFTSKEDCENYLVKVGVKKYKTMQINSNGSGKFLKNSKKTQFLICKEFDKKKLYSWQ